MANENRTKKDDMRSAMQLISVVAIGAGIYGFKLGRNYGYKNGVKEGYSEAASEFIDVMRGLTDELKVMGKLQQK